MAPHADEPPESNTANNGANRGDGDTHDGFVFQYPPTIPEDSPYRVLDQYHSKPTKIRVACVGAGASGLALAYKMEKNLVPGSWSLTLFEKNPHFGGTWYENTYPGVACDVSVETPSLPFIFPSIGDPIPTSLYNIHGYTSFALLT